jgi:N-acetylneuraminic acid mutarotase
MHLPRTAPRLTRRSRTLVAAVAAAALVTIGMASPASAGVPATSTAAKATAATTPVATPKVSKKNAVKPLCTQPKKGMAQCFALKRTDVTAHKGIQPNATVSGYGPADLSSAYALPANGGAGQTVAIVDAFDDPNAEADLATYRTQFGLPACTTANGCFRKVDQRGGTNYPVPNAGWAGEISLDVDMVSAVAPAAHILLVEADDNGNDNLGAAVDEAVALGAKYVSNSYGSGYTSAPGSGEDPSEVTDGDPHYNHPGVAVVASTGDDDFGVSYPAASQYVTAVGGTTLVPDSSARGWTESVWNNSFGGPGSGCSLYEAKPAWQTDSGCDMRTEADVSADADPLTGVAVYDTYQDSGWGVFGGTSASSPIIASVFADAGTPVANTYPSSYPYANTSHLNDVTTGNNGTCSPAYLCTAGTGYDGPTGLGTPNGLSAFSTGPHGLISGRVTDSSTGTGIAGAEVTIDDSVATSDASGHYSVSVPVGTYDANAAAYGYASKTISGVAITDGGSVTENFALDPVPTSTVSGTVTDGSGHHWPLYATITADGVPGGPVFTDPYTGHYSLTLPQGQTFTLHVSANYPGYQAVTQDVTVGTSDTNADIRVPVDANTCVAPGYTVATTGTTQTFDGTTTPAGWSVVNNTAVGGWEFDDPHPRGNLTGGSGGFAIIDSDFLGIGNTEDTFLVSPTTDFTGVVNPDLGFDTDYHALDSTADVDVSVDGGATWTNVWDQAADFRGPAHVDLPLPMAANKSAVQVRFHYTGTWAWWWEVDNVFLGSRTCNPIPGGLVAGTVTDANTKTGIVGATVTSVDKPAESATTAATPADPNLADGFYWMFSSLTGKHSFTAAKKNYVSKTKSVNVAANFTTQAAFNLAAGRVKITPTSIAKTVPWQGTASQVVTVKNTGGAPVNVTLGEQAGGSTLLTAHGAPLNRVKGKYSPRSLHGKDGTVTKATGVKPADGTPADAPWTSIANYPVTIQDNGVVSLNGTIYSAFGYDGGGDESSLYAYDPGSGSWTALASAADTREKPAMAALNGKIYASGGWGGDGSPDGKTEVYDPATGAWTTAATNPDPLAGSGVAVIGSKMYVVGGCTASACGSADVNVYDAATDTWSQAADYPEPTSWESCGAIGGTIYCAGGTTDAGTSVHTYAYDPGSDSWSPEADMPIDLWGSGYTAADGELLVSGGVTQDNAVITNQGYAFDPTSDAWSPLPNSNNTLYRGGSTCGFYKVGGNPGGLGAPPMANSEVLPGFVDCGQTADVSWLSVNPTTLTIAAGASATFTVAVNANVPDITQPGTYTAAVTVGTDTPYAVPVIPVSMTVNPPKTWGKITGTVNGPSGPIPGATVQINTWATHYTLKTDAQGHYALWLDVRNNPLQLIVAKDGFQPQTTTVRITKGTTTTVNFTLLKD